MTTSHTPRLDRPAPAEDYPGRRGVAASSWHWPGRLHNGPPGSRLRHSPDVVYAPPAEPTKMYLDKGGRAANTEERQCLYAVLAATDLPQQRPNGYDEPAIVTSGGDFSAVAAPHRSRPDSTPYPARAVIDYLSPAPVRNDP